MTPALGGLRPQLPLVEVRSHITTIDSSFWSPDALDPPGGQGPFPALIKRRHLCGTLSRRGHWPAFIVKQQKTLNFTQRAWTFYSVCRVLGMLCPTQANVMETPVPRSTHAGHGTQHKMDEKCCTRRVPQAWVVSFWWTCWASRLCSKKSPDKPVRVYER